jgi:hypothetical protein
MDCLSRQALRNFSKSKRFPENGWLLPIIQRIAMLQALYFGIGGPDVKPNYN